MYLGELIEALEKHDPAQVVPRGFSRPHSYRGYYERLAFEPTPNVTVGAMLADAKSAMGQTFEGWKGGDYQMDEFSQVYLAERGSTGQELVPMLLAYMLGDIE